MCQVRDELLRVGRSLASGERATAREEDLLRLPLNAYPDRVCRRREKDPAAGAIVGGGGVRLAPESAVRRGDFFLAVDLRHDPWSATREATVRVASLLEPEWLAETFPGSVRRERGAEYDAERERVVGFVRTWYRDLIIADEPNAAVDVTTAGLALAAALRSKAVELFAADEAVASLLARVGLLRAHLSQHPWPTFDEAELGDVLAEACDGKRSLEEMRRGGALANGLRNRLAYPMDRVLEEQAPDGIVVPSGNRIRLEYASNGPPVLAVRLQEFVRVDRDAADRGRAGAGSAAPVGAELPAGAGDGGSSELLGDDLLPGAEGPAGTVPEAQLAGRTAGGEGGGEGAAAAVRGRG